MYFNKIFSLKPKIILIKFELVKKMKKLKLIFVKVNLIDFIKI